MRLFLFLLLLPLGAPAQECRTSAGNADSVPQDAVNNIWTCTNLYIDSPITFSNHINPVTINVTGNVEISANVNLNGSAGANSVGPGVTGGAGGPGAGTGGGTDFLGNPQDGGDFVTANGKASPNDPTCGNGGGGAGMFSAGVDGTLCSTSANNIIGEGGNVAPTTEFDFTLALFRGGYGGGAGGFNSGEFGSGGGGGGALHIDAGGNVIIKAGVTISARGGAGGNVTNDGGGGGGGSGGAIWIEAAGNITNLGTIDLRGGNGGPNANPTGGHGGRGGSGQFLFSGANGTSAGSGPSTPSKSSPNFKSDISCGTIAPQKNDHLTQMVFGFMLAGAVISLIDRLKKKLLASSRA